MTDWISSIDWNMTIWAIIFLIFWLALAIRHPIATFVALGLTCATLFIERHDEGFLSSTNIIWSYMLWSMVVALFVTRLGRVFLIAFGLGFILNFFIANGDPD
jgi:hypothetical protein